MTKVAILFTNFGPYHLARFQGFQNHCQLLGWETVGIELTRSGVAYEWQTEIDELGSAITSVLDESSLSHVNPVKLLRRLRATLFSLSPDVMAIGGYFRLGFIAALIWGRINGKPVILLSESKEDDAKRTWIVEQLKAKLIGNYTTALVGGKAHKRYLQNLGMADESIFLGYNVVGNELFHPERNSTLPRPLDKPYFLTINRFIPKKNLLLVLEAYAAYVHNSATATKDLVLCGDGPLRTDLETKAKELGVTKQVHMPGFLQQEELLPYFAHADCFIHASTQEQWGLVVNEAMAAGLPVLVSNRCGCFEDLVIEGINGFGFAPDAPEQLTELMNQMSYQSVDLKQMGQASLNHIQKYSPDYFAKGLTQAVQYALKSRKA